MEEQTTNSKSRSIFIFCLFLLNASSCSTKLMVADSKTTRIDRAKEFIIVQNPQSKIFTVGIYPSYKIIDQFVFDSKPAFQRIDSLILKELVINNIRSEIVDEHEVPKIADALYLRYQDYWSWDLKLYMHLLIISLYDASGNKLSEYVSQGNTAGMHDYPMPKKQVPKLVGLILNQ